MNRMLAFVIATGALLATPVDLARAQTKAAAPDKAKVLATYADIAEAMYGDSLATARGLQKAIATLTATPSEAALKAAREAWIAARVPYQQSESFRFGNPIVDEWEGRVNSWPLDEGLIDYVDAKKYGDSNDENPWYTANVIANPTLKIGGKTVNAKTINWQLLRGLQEAGKVEANVATGYHAIEFLLWGQDLNGTGPGAGNRPWTDYAKGTACTNKNCDRRAQYLTVATQLLVDDLAWITRQWAADGEARAELAKKPDAGIGAIVTGIGSLSYGELAGERMKLGLMLHDPEEEHDCFSDNTHNSHYYNVIGMQAIYLGGYKRVNGKEVKGPSLSQLIAATQPALDVEMKQKLSATVDAMSALKKRAETVERYDQMLADGNAEGNATIQKAIDALTDQTKSLERIVASLKLDKIKFEGSDSLDEPTKVKKK